MLLLKRGMLLMLRWLNRGGWRHLLAYEKVLWWKAVTMSKKFYSAAISAAGPYLPKLACFSAAAEWLHAVDPYHHRKSSPMDTPPNTSEAKANAMSNNPGREVANIHTFGMGRICTEEKQRTGSSFSSAWELWTMCRLSLFKSCQTLWVAESQGMVSNHIMEEESIAIIRHFWCYINKSY